MLVGLDVGTEGIRAVVFNENTKQFHEYKESYKLYFPSIDQAVQKPLEIFSTLKDILKKLPKTDKTIHIGFSSVFHSIIALDEDLNPITDSIIWADRRAMKEKEFLEKRYGSRFFYERTGCPLHAMYWPAKLLWIKNRYSNVSKFVSIKSFLIYKMSGQIVEDLSLASATGMMNIHTKEWDEEILKILKIKKEQLPEIISPYKIIKARKEFAREVGFDEIFIVPGAGDGVLANLGVGAIREKIGVITVGTSGAVRVVFKRPVLDQHGASTWCYLLDEENYVLGSAINNGGIVLSWLKENMKFENYDEIIQQAIKSPVGAKGLIFLPYLNGERCPNWFEKYKGVLVGLTSLHSREHIARATLEAVGFRVKDMYESIKKVGKVKFEKIIATGGFTNSKEWVQIVSNILGEKIEITNTTNQSAIGAYLMAMKATNVDWRKFLDSYIKTEKIIQPQKNAIEKYQKIYEKYRYLYQLLLGYWDNFEEINEVLE